MVRTSEPGHSRADNRKRLMFRMVVQACLGPGLAAFLAAGVAAFPAQAQTSKAPVIWRQAMIAPKADAGFFLMAARRGFAEQEGLKIEVVDVKDDGVGVRALLSGEVDSFDSATGGVTVTAK